MVTKMAAKIDLKLRNLLFWTIFKAFSDRFFKNQISAQANAKKTFNILCAMIILTLCNNIFLVFACALCLYLCQMS